MDIVLYTGYNGTPPGVFWDTDRKTGKILFETQINNMK